MKVKLAFSLVTISGLLFGRSFVIAPEFSMSLFTTSVDFWGNFMNTTFIFLLLQFSVILLL